MPKKTRKDKIMAQRRRTSAQPLQTTPVQSSSIATPLYTFRSTSEKKLQQTIEERSVELVTIKRDLYKTIILAAIAFSAELYIYWLLQQ
jgi:hypothetical protein